MSRGRSAVLVEGEGVKEGAGCTATRPPFPGM
jgi:hypothetical protein